MGEMYMAMEINTDVIERQKQALEAVMTTDPEMQKRLREIIDEELKEARQSVVNSIRFENGDPRGAAQSVRRVVYQKMLGGNINILNRKSAGNRSNYEAPRKVYPGMKGQRGGNRAIRSDRTEAILHYGPLERGFILRMVNSGTKPRYANGRNGKWTNGGNKTFGRLQEQGDYYRGSISARNFFGSSASRALQVAVEKLAGLIEQEFNKLFA